MSILGRLSRVILPTVQFIFIVKLIHHYNIRSYSIINFGPAERVLPIREEMHTLAKRRHYVNLAITFGTTAALLVCVSIAVVFLGAMLKASVTTAVASLFILAMGAFVAALVFFLREVLLAVRSLILS